MMRRMIAVALAALMVVVFAQPANAEDGKYQRTSCVAWDGTGSIFRKEVCPQVRWRNQTDGDGIVLEFLDVDTVDGCIHMGNPKYWNTGAHFKNPAQGVFIKGWEWGVEPCNWTKDFQSIRGTDTGAMDFYLAMCADDDYIWFNIRLYYGGNSVLLSKGHEETC